MKEGTEPLFSVRRYGLARARRCFLGIALAPLPALLVGLVFALPLPVGISSCVSLVGRLLVLV